MTSTKRRQEYDEACAELVALQEKLRQLKTDYEAARSHTLSLWKEAQQRVKDLKRQLGRNIP